MHKTTMDRRQFQLALLGAALVPAGVRAQGTATKLMVGFAPGGSVDNMARLVAEALQRQLGRTFIVENRTGAGGRLVPEQVARAKPDGQTLMVVPHGPITLFPSLYPKLRYNPARDFTPIAQLVSYGYAMVASRLLDLPDAAALKRWVRSAGAKASYGSPGAGTVPHFVGVSVARALDVTMTHVPYRGAAPAMVDVVGGVVPLAFAPTADAAELARAGKLKILATSGVHRGGATPRVPTFKEYGIDVELDGWFALYGPAGLPQPQVDELKQAVATVLAEPALRERLTRMSLDAAPGAPAQLKALQQREQTFWQPVVKASGFTPED
jgi:tripartite-type tricarboxylate transporter receptor subunit TctC